MKKKLTWLFLVTELILTSSGCDNGASISMPFNFEDTTPYPLVTCNDFATPTPPGGATETPLLIVRIQFEGDPNDSSFTANPYDYNNFYSDACTWAKKIFYNAEEGQLNHYFNAVSYDHFHLEPAAESHDNDGGISDGIITVTLSGNHPNPQSSGYFHQELVDALTIADAYIDFSSFDVSSDGVIHRSDLQVMFLVAGYESATTSGSSYHGVWAHKWCLYGQEGVLPPTLDGVSLLSCSGNGYSRFGERHQTDWYDATIGVIAHELGHAIWLLPDLYDTDSSSAGIGSFGLMGYGSWGREQNENAGATPVHPSAWVKNQIGWVTAAIPGSGSSPTLNDTAQSSYNIVKVDIASDANQYFLLENRATTGYDKGLYILNDIPVNGSFAGGLAIWHIDEGQSGNSNESRKQVDLEEANNAGLDSLSHYGRRDNLFYTGNQTDFDSATTPDSDDNGEAGTSVDISSISAAGTAMTATVTY